MIGVTGATVPCSDPRLAELTGSLGREGGSRAYLEELRWPDGVSCPRCDSDRVGYLEERRKHYCRDCAYQFRVTAGTVLHDTHVPAADWLTAVGLILDSPRGFPATRLQEILGGSYKTAWFIEHRIRAAMAQSLDVPGPPHLSGGQPISSQPSSRSSAAPSRPSLRRRP